MTNDDGLIALILHMVDFNSSGFGTADESQLSGFL